MSGGAFRSIDVITTSLLLLQIEPNCTSIPTHRPIWFHIFPHGSILICLLLLDSFRHVFKVQSGVRFAVHLVFVPF